LARFSEKSENFVELTTGEKEIQKISQKFLLKKWQNVSKIKNTLLRLRAFIFQIYEVATMARIHQKPQQ